MKRVCSSIALALLCVASLQAHAQQTTVTATNLRISGLPIPSGTVSLTPTNGFGVPIPFSDGSGYANSPTAFVCAITNGAIGGAQTQSGTFSGTCQVPDSNLTTPAHITYSAQICDTSTGNKTSGQCYTELVSGLAGSTFALDHYGPPAQTTNFEQLVTSQGTTNPSTCQAPFIFANTATSTLYVCVSGSLVAFGGGASNSVNLHSLNGYAEVDSVASTNVYGYQAYGDSITYGAGAASQANAYAYRIAADTGASLNDQGVPGDKSGDMSFHVFTVANPGDSGNPIVTTMIGTNDEGAGPSALGDFAKHQYASHAWLALSSRSKVLVGASGVTATGTTSAETTFANAAGLTCTTGPCTFTYPAHVGPSGAFYVWYEMRATGGTLSVTSDGSPLTDTVTSATSVNTAWVAAPTAQTVTVGAARYVVTPGAHTLVITASTGATVLGFGFAPTQRYRGLSAPRVFMGGVPPQQNAANDATVLQFNAASLAVAEQLAADGLAVQFVDVHGAMDPVLDFVGSATQNCDASTNPGLHPNGLCGHAHIAGAFEANINAAPAAPQSALTSALNFTGVAAPTTVPQGANGGTTQNQYPNNGSTFPPNTYCANGFANYCWGITQLGTGPFATIIMANANSGEIAFSFPPSSATPSQVWNAIKGTITPDGVIHGLTLAPANAPCSASGNGSVPCGAAPSGVFAVNAGNSTFTVQDTAVTAVSTITVNFDSSLGSQLGFTCNTTYSQPYVSARTVGTSFTVSWVTTPSGNPPCLSFSITN